MPKIPVCFSLVMLALLVSALMAACGIQPVSVSDLPIYPGASHMGRGQNEMVDQLADIIEDSSGSEGVTVEVMLYSLPAGTTWETVQRYYRGEMDGTGWNPEDDLSNESDIFSTRGWSRGRGASEQAVVVGYVGNPVGAGAFMMVGLFSE